MNAWHHLGVERNASSKDIKRAYAQKLKVTRPDQKPAEFQLLHQAYKFALSFANRREGRISEASSDALINAAVETAHLENFDDGEVDNKESTVSAAAEEIFAANIHNHDAASETDNNLALDLALRQEEYKRIITEVNILLQNNSIPRDLQKWHFLANSPYILENEFNSQLGRHLFFLLSRYGQTRVRRTRGKYYKREVPRSLIRYCDEIFSWRNHAGHLMHEFGQDFCRLVFSKLDDNYSANNFAQGVRGGVIVHEVRETSSQPGPTRTYEPRNDRTSSFGGGNIFFIIMALMTVMNLLRECSPASGH